MATAGATRGRSPAKTTGQAKAQQEMAEVSLPSRREFLYYIWGASMVLLLGELGAGILWFAYPRFAEGTFGGVFNFSPDAVPAEGTAPVSEPIGRFHVTNTEDGLTALYGVCTHLGCLPKWTETNFRFECPCHGSKFTLSGAYIEGPAPRSLDRFITTVTFDDGTVETTDSEGNPIPIQGRRIAKIEIDTGNRIMRTGALARS